MLLAQRPSRPLLRMRGSPAGSLKAEAAGRGGVWRGCGREGVGCCRRRPAISGGLPTSLCEWKAGGEFRAPDRPLSQKPGGKSVRLHVHVHAHTHTTALTRAGPRAQAGTRTRTDPSPQASPDPDSRPEPGPAPASLTAFLKMRKKKSNESQAAAVPPRRFPISFCATTATGQPEFSAGPQTP